MVSLKMAVTNLVNSLTVFVPVAAVCSVLLLGLWLPSRNSASIIAFAALYGLFSGKSQFRVCR